MLAGTYMAEYGRYSKLTIVVRFINDILLSAPSIVIGLFVYRVAGRADGAFLGDRRRGGAGRSGHPGRRAHHRGHAAAGAGLAARSGVGARPAALAMSFSASPIAPPRPASITGVLLAVARVCGETAPLLFTALNNQFWSLDLNAPMASLPVVIFQFALSPYKDWQQLAWTGALLITVAVLALSIAARALSAPEEHRNDRHAGYARQREPPTKVSVRDLDFFYGDDARAEEHHDRRCTPTR